MTGDADVDLAIHAFLEQVGQAGEQVIEPGEAFLELDAHLADLLGHHAPLEAIARAVTALHVFAHAEVGYLFAQGEHELLLGADFPRQLRHLLDQPAKVAWQRVLGQQLGQVLGGLLQPVGGGAQTRIVGEMADGLVRQVVAFVEHVHRVAWVGQHCTATERQVGKNHVMVGDDDVDLTHAFAGFIEDTLLKIRAMPASTLAVVGGQARPVLVLEGFGPTVAVAIPAVAGKLLDHAVEQLLAALIHLDVETFLFEQLSGGRLRVAFLQQHVEFGQAQVAAPPFGQREAEIQAAIAHQVGKILEDDLLLQGDGGGGNHQTLARSLGSGDRGEAVGDRLAGTGAGLDRHHGGFTRSEERRVGKECRSRWSPWPLRRSSGAGRSEA